MDLKCGYWIRQKKQIIKAVWMLLETLGVQSWIEKLIFKYKK